ncbi:hypothetical protein LXL04_011205 [Taraxacum kok-saghyz]
MGTKGTEPSCFCITASSPSHNSFSTPDDQHITISYPPEDHCTTVASHSDDHHITISAPYHDHWSTILPNLIEHKPPPSFTLIPRLFISRISYQIYCGVLEHDRLCIENNIVLEVKVTMPPMIEYQRFQISMEFANFLTGSVGYQDFKKLSMGHSIAPNYDTMQHICHVLTYHNVILYKLLQFADTSS